MADDPQAKHGELESKEDELDKKSNGPSQTSLQMKATDEDSKMGEKGEPSTQDDEVARPADQSEEASKTNELRDDRKLESGEPESTNGKDEKDASTSSAAPKRVDEEGEDVDDEDEDEDEDEDNEEETNVVQPITDSREISFNLRDLNEHLVCKLCNGYFREAHTIMECLHTFCKVCLYNYLLTRDDRVGTSRKSDCPICHINLLNAEPMKNHVRFDRTKQNIVDLIVPHFQEQDKNLKRSRAKANLKKPPAPAPKKQKTTKEEGNQETKKKMPKVYLIFELRPFRARKKDGNVGSGMKDLVKPWLRTSPKLTVKHLKKYIKMKLDLDNFNDIELTCQDEVLGTDHTLEFIKKTRWHEKSNLVLHYRLRNQ